jgi:AraC-like DNA-binding protein
MTEGQCRYFIDGNTYQLYAGDIVLIPEGVIHNSEYSDSVHSRLLINCASDIIPTEVKNEFSSLLYLYRNPKTTNEIRQIFDKIGEEYGKGDSLSYGVLTCYTRILFYTLLRSAEQRRPIDVTNRTVSSVIETMKNELSSDITLKDMAKRFSVSQEHLSRIFKKETGIGFSSYLTFLRMKKAEELLIHSSESRITEIAYACGFSDSNYFSSQFKRLHGISPKKF